MKNAHNESYVELIRTIFTGRSGKLSDVESRVIGSFITYCKQKNYLYNGCSGSESYVDYSVLFVEFLKSGGLTDCLSCVKLIRS